MTWQSYLQFMEAMQARIAEKLAGQQLRSGRGVEVNDRIITLDPVTQRVPTVSAPLVSKALFAEIIITRSEGTIKVAPAGYEPQNGTFNVGRYRIITWGDVQDIGADLNVQVSLNPGLFVHSGDYISSDVTTADLVISPLTVQATVNFSVRGFVNGMEMTYDEGSPSVTVSHGQIKAVPVEAVGIVIKAFVRNGSSHRAPFKVIREVGLADHGMCCRAIGGWLFIPELHRTGITDR